MCSILSSRTVFSLVVLLVLSSSPIFGYLANAQEENEDGQEQQKDIPDVNATIGGETVSIRDSNLRVETIAEGLEFPTTMAFLGPNDILILEKEKGTVQRIVNGKILPEPLLDVNVATSQESACVELQYQNIFLDTPMFFSTLQKLNQQMQKTLLKEKSL